ncbi:hypothetical protein GT755_32170 [Herbidospora sp. NEAU-GS84]|uniref:Uncharacterized protein n=1 Tax=Herbidospora solisilvae TaxID=2696284 RepID=A0A7C9P2G8_9ACTN|nr:hypothetical protein [Herbidospora solisilvae]NAS26317.1 hypothetical protein [Herbidospora solisilvae]
MVIVRLIVGSTGAVGAVFGGRLLRMTAEMILNAPEMPWIPLDLGPERDHDS